MRHRSPVIPCRRLGRREKNHLELLQTLPLFSRGNATTTHSSTVSNNLYVRRLQAVFPAVKKSSGAEGERYTRLRGDWLSRMSPVFQGACKEIEKRVIKRAGKTRCWISPEDSWCVITYVITGFSNVLCWIAWCVCEMISRLVAIECLLTANVCRFFLLNTKRNVWIIVETRR